MTIPMQDESNSGMLEFMSNYYEFIPVNEYGSHDPTILEAHELQEGESYYILLTNAGGLFRYDIHDVVQCVGFEGQTPLLTFLHKGAHCTNVAGEKLTEYQVATAVREGFNDLNRSLETVMLVPVMGNPPRYKLLVEPESDDYSDRLAAIIDARLSDLNCEYQDRIRTRRLQPISVQQVPAGSWSWLREQKIAQGGSQEQYKHSFLGTSDEVIHDLSSSSLAIEPTTANRK